MDSESLYRHIGRLIKERRKKLKPPLTQEKLAQQIGMSRAALANIETGRQSVLVHQLYAFAAALDLTPDAFLLPPNDATTKSNVSDFPLPENLKPSQKQQLTRLLSGAQADFNRDGEDRNAKQKKG
jgi:transcriptional regulator with XRE-family HTH domain